MTIEQKKDYVRRWMIVYNSPDGPAWIHPGIMERLRRFQKEIAELKTPEEDKGIKDVPT